MQALDSSLLQTGPRIQNLSATLVGNDLVFCLLSHQMGAYSLGLLKESNERVLAKYLAHVRCKELNPS